MTAAIEENDPVRVIELFPIWTNCYRCGKDTILNWGFPIDEETGAIVPTWFEDRPGFSWGGAPACKSCYEAHQRWSEAIVRPFDAPLC